MSASDPASVSARNHSPEPWTLAKSGVSVDAGSVRIRQEPGAPREELAANARRLAACVNACAGISTEDLEKAASLDPYSRLIQVSYVADQAAASLEGRS